MLAGTIQTWIKRRIAVRQRLARMCTSYLLFLMVVTTKHSLEEAARFSGLHKSLFSKLMKPPRSKLRGITRKGFVCETPRFLTLFPLQGNLEASSEESPD